VADVDAPFVKKTLTFLRVKGNRTYIMTAKRMISDEVLK